MSLNGDNLGVDAMDQKRGTEHQIQWVRKHWSKVSLRFTFPQKSFIQNYSKKTNRQVKEINRLSSIDPDACRS